MIATTLGLAALLLGSCQQQPTAPRRVVRDLTPSEIAGISLAYICGNTFRVRNPNAEEVVVTWHVLQSEERDSLTLPPAPGGQQYSETYFTTMHTGSVRLFYNGQQIQQESNGNKPPCQIPGDTARPVVPSVENFPNDSSVTVSPPGLPTVLYYRNVLLLQFDDSTSGTTVNSLLQRYSATIIGGAPNLGAYGAYVIQVPDPGPSYAQLDSLIQALDAEPGVFAAYQLAYRDLWDPRGRYPSDGPGQAREDWFSGANSLETAAWKSIRAPSAWGCETGNYGSSPKIGVIDFSFDTAQGDLRNSIHRPVLYPPDTSVGRNQWLVDPGVIGMHTRSHGTAVAGILSAEGDNGLGVAGMLWHSDLFLYPYGWDTVASRSAPEYFAVHIIPDAISQGVRVLVTSTSSGFGGAPAQVQLIQLALARYLAADPRNMFFFAAGEGQNGVSRTLADWLSSSDNTVTAMDKAVGGLWSQFPGQVYVVIGSNGSGSIWGGSDLITDMTQIAAPAENITLLGRTADFLSGTYVATGNSFATPFLAGSAAQLIAFDSTLTGAEVLSYLMAGDTVSRYDPATGMLVKPSSLSGAPAGTYQMDAYGALSVLSRTRAHTPVCGFPVSAYNFQVHLERGPGLIDSFPVPITQAVSVAQGGRLMTVGTGVGSGLQSNIAYVYDYLGNQLNSLSGITQRLYLERDTLDVTRLQAGIVELTLRRADGNISVVDPFTEVNNQVYGGTAGVLPLRVVPSPAGDFVELLGQYSSHLQASHLVRPDPPPCNNSDS